MKTCSADLVTGDRCPNRCEGSTEFCASHNKLRRDNRKREQKEDEKRVAKMTGPKLKRGRKPKPVSDKRKEQNKEYFKLVEQFKKDNPICAAKINEFCTVSTDDPHHSRGRGEYLMVVETWVPVCRSCHNYIEQHPLDALKRGLSFSRLAKDEKTI